MKILYACHGRKYKTPNDVVTLDYNFSVYPDILVDLTKSLDHNLNVLELKNNKDCFDRIYVKNAPIDIYLDLKNWKLKYNFFHNLNYLMSSNGKLIINNWWLLDKWLDPKFSFFKSQRVDFRFLFNNSKLFKVIGNYHVREFYGPFNENEILEKEKLRNMFMHCFKNERILGIEHVITLSKVEN